MTSRIIKILTYAIFLTLLPLQTQALNRAFYIVPACSLEYFDYKVIATFEDLRLIDANPKFFLQHTFHQPQCSGFIDVTDQWKKFQLLNEPTDYFLKSYLANHPSDFTHTYKIKHQHQVESLFEQIRPHSVRDSIRHLTHFRDRSATTASGRTAGQYIKDQIALIKAQHNNLEFSEIPIAELKQPNLILKINGGKASDEAIVLGAHLDTLPSVKERQPGADDNASGAAVLLETARILVDRKIKFEKPIYFIWYGGAELGLLGSQQVVEYFNRNHIAVDAILNLDQAGYEDLKSPGIGLIDDMTDAGLTAFIADLISVYLKVPVGVVRCGYACSDHAIWYLNGNRVAYPYTMINDDGNFNAHHRSDTLATLSIKHVTDFVKLSLAFAVELGG